MRAEEFRQLLSARPFSPLRVHRTDGTTYDIRHPEQVLVSRQRIDIGLPPSAGTGVFERIEHCSLLHVVRVEELQTQPRDASGDNGE